MSAVPKRRMLVFEPQPDITTYELALVVKATLSNDPRKMPEWEQIRRHFRESGETRDFAQQAPEPGAWS